MSAESLLFSVMFVYIFQSNLFSAGSPRSERDIDNFDIFIYCSGIIIYPTFDGAEWFAESALLFTVPCS